MIWQMLIGLLSDTHIPEVAPALPPQITKVFRDVDLILHAGDIYIPSVLDQLEHIAPVMAARGDDDADLRDKRVEWKHVLNIEGHTLWLEHDVTYQRMVTPWREGVSTWLAKGEIPDIIIFGHDHSNIIQRRNDILYINPGSPTFLNYRSGLGTVALLRIEPGKAEAEIISLDKVSPGSI